ncbi:uncharacterized protein BDZ99DRAFT_573700 [Mytilinidion resinicola]|uniref:Ankyrin n=1 Tax=Mytilinidion resinicola TaxID=574789 RepID=A0A6A6YDY6_9PEZI|nr:uncharacterized protein BDZ99DRAFT_573700 [Mytilinidion resinicola]KAF2807026.1 hypothetical protein BDZ99DRAFT_573700 [Mytilinidion resinicola]
MALSIAANAFSVVGLADVVTRTGQTLTGGISDICQAASDAEELLREIGHISQIVTATRLFVVEFQSSPFTSEDFQVLPDFQAALNGCLSEFEYLAKRASQARHVRSDGIAARVGKSMKWAEEEGGLASARQRLESHRVSLMTTLSLAGRQQELAIRKKLQRLGDTLGDLQFSADARTALLEKEVKNYSANIAKIRHEVSGSRTARSKLTRQVHNASKEVVQVRAAQKRSFAKQALSTSALISKVDNLQNTIDTISDEVVYSRMKCTSCGVRLEILTMPLLLMRQPLSNLLQSMKTARNIKGSAFELDWILSEFEEILAGSHSASAKAALTRSKRSSQAVTMRNTDAEHEKRLVLSTKECMPSLGLAHASTAERRVTFLQPCNHFKAVMGQNDKTLLHVAEDYDAETGVRVSCTVGATFLPDPERSNIGLTITLSLESHAFQEDLTDRHITPYLVIPSYSKAIDYTTSDEVEPLLEMLQTNEISVFDRDQEGRTLLWHAASNCQLHTFRALLEAGADPLRSSLTGEDVIWYIWSINFPGQPYLARPSLRRKHGTAIKMTRLALQYGCKATDHAWKRHGGLLNMLCNLMEAVSEDYPLSRSLRSLTTLGYSLEDRNRQGETVLLAFIRRSLMMHITLTTILDLGANTRAVDRYGRGPIHVCFEQESEPKPGLVDRDRLLRRRLVDLLRAGSDPNLLDSYGLSPSDLVDTPELWGTWESCLQVVGMKIREGDEDEDAWVVYWDMCELDSVDPSAFW